VGVPYIPRRRCLWPWNSTLACLLLLPAFFAATSQSTAAGEPTSPASVPSFVDVHTHLEPADLSGSIEAALAAVAREDAVKIVVMPPPLTADDPHRYDADLVLPKVPDRARIVVLGGGGTLNAMIQESARTGVADAALRRRFSTQAEELLRLGAQGFGEMAAEHFQGGTAYQSAPPDHPLFLLLADIAAAHDVPIDLHMEAVAADMALPAGLQSPPNPPRLRANIAAFERLLAHNPRAKVIWAHAGTDYTGDRTPDLCRRLLSSHANLSMELKIDPANPGRNPLLAQGASGQIKTEWLKLLEDFPDRFVVGSDQHYPEPSAKLQRWQVMVTLLNQLPDTLRQQIARDNALKLYPPRGSGTKR
jgi:predicted TIM-barrel fold metal-dependent hydrolase